ncbi:hypothetical protein [Polyangium sp. 15x6]|uniref:DUF6891 domain-containing protein n=1 Tax=Polyangium sp. 15x6 TaxID=3042687 RepID=UPI00249CA77C|nr:hypothetical protein [Polyangium sp. 15x6]MDI3284093.1 hypothetical protein [Polyangium sp. 15x6]
MSDDAGWIFDHVKSLMRAGTTKKELFDSVKAMCADPKYDEVAPKVRGYAAKLWSRAEAEERGWKDVSTNDRIDAAFEDLTKRGIFTAQNFTCCSSCGHSEAWGAMSETSARGYVFYHQQDTERGVENGGLMLAYGAREDGPAAVEAVGREICDALDRFGVPWTWNGKSDTRIEIEPFEWRKRRASARPPIPLGTRGTVLPRPERGPAWTEDLDGETAAPAAPAEPPPAVTLRHEDGREWSAWTEFNALRIRIKDTDGDIVERKRACRDPRAELDGIVAELRADGFS